MLIWYRNFQHATFPKQADKAGKGDVIRSLKTQDPAAYLKLLEEHKSVVCFCLQTALLSCMVLWAWQMANSCSVSMFLLLIPFEWWSMSFYSKDSPMSRIFNTWTAHRNNEI